MLKDKKNNLPVLISLLLLSTSIYCKEICIENFNKQLCNNFKLLDSVIIKSALSKQQLISRLNKSVQQLAFLKNSNLYLVESSQPLEYSQQLVKYSYISYAQPNIAQIRNKNNQFHQNIVHKYALKKKWPNTLGEGVNIAIIDDGFNLEHEDLKGVDIAFLYDADQKNLDASPKLNIDNHGTQVTGIIFSQHNGIGIDGIAPKASLIAIRQANNVTSDTILAFTVASKAGAHIINCSWNSPVLLEPVFDVIKDLANNNIAIVFAAGNDAKEIQAYSIEASIAEVITVGAIQEFSNFGKILDFSLNGANIKTTRFDGTYGYFGGTSATAPIVSGLIALELSQHKNKPIDEIITIIKSLLQNSGD